MPYFKPTLLLLLGVVVLLAQSTNTIKLPPPQQTGGKPLFETLSLRQSNRTFSSQPLPLNILSTLLWATNGINRPESGKRTAPSARNMQEIDVYVALPEGLYLYEPRTHTLQLIAPRDIRALTGMQPFCAQAALNLIFVADYDRMGNLSEEQKSFYAATDAGFCSQNAYLCCAAVGLNTVVRASINRENLASAMQLRPSQKIVLAQTIGYPAE